MNISLTKIILKLVMKGAKAMGEALKVNNLVD